MRPSPPISAVSSSIRSRGNGGSQSGLSAILISFIGLSSAATRLELSAPQRLQRCMIAHSPPFRTQTATGSIIPPQSLSRSPGSISTCRLDRQFGQWLRCELPAFSGNTGLPQTLQVKVSLQACVCSNPFQMFFFYFHGSLFFLLKVYFYSLREERREWILPTSPVSTHSPS